MAVELMPRWAQAGWICPPSGLMEPLALLTYRPLLRKLDLRGATHLPGKLPQIVPPRVLSTQPITEVFIFYHHFHKFLPRRQSSTSAVPKERSRRLPLSVTWSDMSPPCHLLPPLFWWIRFRHEGWGRPVLNQSADDESLSSGQRVFTAQSLNSAGLPIRPPSIWLEDQSAANRAVKGDTEGKW